MRETKEMREVYRDFLLEHVEKREDLAVLEADLSSSMKTDSLKKKMGKRYINVGIMEAQMVGAAAGLSVTGLKPYIHTFGPFASRRVYDQVFISLAYAQLNATIIGSDAGVTAEMNGGTHMPFEELALMRIIPKATVYEAVDDIQFKAILEETLDSDGFNYIRTIRKTPYPIFNGTEDFSKGFVQITNGSDATIIASGIMVQYALEAVKILEERGISTSVINVFRIKPLPIELKELLSGQNIVTVENHNKIGGLGSAICELMDEQNVQVKRIGVDEQFGQVGKEAYLREVYGLTAEKIVEKVEEYIK